MWNPESVNESISKNDVQEYQTGYVTLSSYGLLTPPLPSTCNLKYDNVKQYPDQVPTQSATPDEYLQPSSAYSSPNSPPTFSNDLPATTYASGDSFESSSLLNPFRGGEDVTLPSFSAHADPLPQPTALFQQQKPDWLLGNSNFAEYDASFSAGRQSPLLASFSPSRPGDNTFTNPYYYDDQDPINRQLATPSVGQLWENRADQYKEEFRSATPSVHPPLADGEKRSWPCIFKDCKKVYTTGAGLRYHLHNYHNSPSPRFINRPSILYPCNKCNKSYVTKAGLRYHKQKAGHSD